MPGSTAAAPALPWLERWQSDGTWRVVSGSRFRVALNRQVDSKFALPGDQVQARLVKPLELGGNVLAPAGSLVNGTVKRVTPARTKLEADISVKRWGRRDGLLRLEFKEIVTPDGNRLRIAASPATGTVVENQAADQATVAVTKQGLKPAAPAESVISELSYLVTDPFRKGQNVVIAADQTFTLELQEDLIHIPPVALGPEIAP